MSHVLIHTLPAALFLTFGGIGILMMNAGLDKDGPWLSLAGLILTFICYAVAMSFL